MPSFTVRITRRMFATGISHDKQQDQTSSSQPERRAAAQQPMGADSCRHSVTVTLHLICKQIPPSGTAICCLSRPPPIYPWQTARLQTEVKVITLHVDWTQEMVVLSNGPYSDAKTFYEIATLQSCFGENVR